MAERLTLVNSTLFALPIYTICIVKLPVTIINSIDRERRDCLWKGNDVNANCKPMILWDKVITPKDRGGLRVINIKMHNQVLLMKHLHKFYDRIDTPWVELIWKTHYSSGRIPHFSSEIGSFWWEDILRLSNHYRGIAMPIHGGIICFAILQDIWNNMLLKMEFTCLHYFAKRKNCSLAQFM